MKYPPDLPEKYHKLYDAIMGNTTAAEVDLVNIIEAVHEDFPADLRVQINFGKDQEGLIDACILEMDARVVHSYKEIGAETILYDIIFTSLTDIYVFGHLQASYAARHGMSKLLELVAPTTKK